MAENHHDPFAFDEMLTIEDASLRLTNDERGELDDIADLLNDPALWDDPPPELEHRTITAIAQEVRRGGQADRPIADPPVRTPPQAAAPAPIRRSPSSRWAGRIPTLLLGAAAALLVVAGVRVATNKSDNSIPIAMSGTDLAPNLSGTSKITKTASGLKIELRAPGLPRREGNEFYEAWLKDESGKLLVPIGTFHDADFVVLWAGVTLEDFPILTITKETAAGPKDPGQGSSGEVVLKGRR